MIIGDRLKELRENKKLSQGDIEKRSGLLRCYVSRVENGHTVPSVETLEKMSRALEVPMYQLFLDAQEMPAAPVFSTHQHVDWTSDRKGRRLFLKLRQALSRTTEPDRGLLLAMAKFMSSSRRKTSR